MLVEDVMSRDIVTCDAGATLRTAVERMLEHRVGSVIVTEDGNPAGIVTETDALQGGYATGSPFAEIPVRAVASSPLVMTAPRRTLRTAIGTMTDENVKKLPVVDDLDLVGVVTMTDVSRHYGDIVREVHEIERPRGSRASEWHGRGE